MITHYQRLLNYIVPDFVHVLAEGRIVKSGDKSLALELEESGYAGIEELGGDSAVIGDDELRSWPEFASAPRSAFEARGFPTTHDEEWRFTNVAPIAKADLANRRRRSVERA